MDGIFAISHVRNSVLSQADEMSNDGLRRMVQHPGSSQDNAVSFWREVTG